MTITPDTKDWTWVLDRACPECGFDTSAVAGHEVARLIRENASPWVAILRGSSDLRIRPRPDRWSTLEYGCHVRDVLRLADHRVSQMIEEEDPCFANWDQDATAIADDYNRQHAGTVATELQTAASAFAELLDGLGVDGLGAEAWNRPGFRSDGARFSIETFARYLVHDPIHHLHDVRPQHSLTVP